MLLSFISSVWRKPTILGLSALGKQLSKSDVDLEYANNGPEKYGYIILPDGRKSDDITIPIQWLLMNKQEA